MIGVYSPTWQVRFDGTRSDSKRKNDGASDQSVGGPFFVGSESSRSVSSGSGSN